MKNFIDILSIKCIENINTDTWELDRTPKEKCSDRDQEYVFKLNTLKFYMVFEQVIFIEHIYESSDIYELALYSRINYDRQKLVQILSKLSILKFLF